MNHEASSRVLIKLPRDRAWALLQDLTLAHHYVPGVLRCELHGEQRHGVGHPREISVVAEGIGGVAPNFSQTSTCRFSCSPLICPEPSSRTPESPPVILVDH